MKTNEKPRVATMIARAARLRCPHCGVGGVVDGWFAMKPRCPHCGLRPGRGGDDFFLGAMMFNMVFSESLLALVLVGVGIATYPDVPWRLLQYGGIAMMVLAPLAFLPFSRTLWMVVDLLLHPVKPGELEEESAVGG